MQHREPSCNLKYGKRLRLTAVVKVVEQLDFGKFEDNQIDLFGDAYEYLISNMALGNTLTDPQFGDDKPFDAIVSNPIIQSIGLVAMIQPY